VKKPVRVKSAMLTEIGVCAGNEWRRRPCCETLSARQQSLLSAHYMTKSQIPARRILVVDDEPLVCDAVRMMLAFDGHSVETASSGKEALSMFAPGKYDVVLTDYAMPSMKGDELAAAIKSAAPGQPVVMVTAYAEMLRASGQPLTGVDFVISKPFLLEHLREAIRKVAPVAENQAAS
jgi:CheY-like chemotaxis protein